MKREPNKQELLDILVRNSVCRGNFTLASGAQSDLYVDAKTLELQEVVATDKLYEDGHVYPMMFTVTLGWLHDMPVVTHIHGAATYETDAEYLGKGAIVDYDFTDLTFPATLPDWYFEPRSYAAHTDDAPS